MSERIAGEKSGVDVEERGVCCIYCEYAVRPDIAEIVPEVDDDEAWDEMSVFHSAKCEWVLTRAHRRMDAV